MDTADEQAGQIQAGQVGAHELAQGVLGGLYEPAEDRRLRRSQAGIVGLVADRFQSSWVAARGELGNIRSNATSPSRSVEANAW